MVVALLALFISIAGTSYAAIKLPANSVGTKQIKRNAVVSSKIKNGSLSIKDFGAGQIPAGPQGIQGPAGPQGARGPEGPPVLTGVDTRNSGPGGMGSATALCDIDGVATGGGGVSDDGFIYQSYPTPISPPGSIPIGWIASAHHADGTPAMVTAWVVCVYP